jgi:hypothetical protein
MRLVSLGTVTSGIGLTDLQQAVEKLSAVDFRR